jgi:hypothetical protein
MAEKIIQPLATPTVEKLLKDETGLKKLIDYCNDIFKVLDNIHFKIKSRQVVNGTATDIVLDKVLGFLGFIRPIYEAVEAVKKNKEEGFYVNELNTTEEEGGKFVSSKVDKKASHSVADYRVLRNRLRGYVKLCEIDLNILQSKLSYYKSEKA